MHHVRLSFWWTSGCILRILVWKMDWNDCTFCRFVSLLSCGCIGSTVQLLAVSSLRCLGCPCLRSCRWQLYRRPWAEPDHFLQQLICRSCQFSTIIPATSGEAKGFNCWWSIFLSLQGPDLDLDQLCFNQFLIVQLLHLKVLASMLDRQRALMNHWCKRSLW